MDFKFRNNSIFFFTAVLIAVSFFGCAEKEKSNTENTYYVELVNFKFDSLRKSIGEQIFGKATFYKGNDLNILSGNYITDDLPDLLYFNNVEILKEKISEGSKKIRIEMLGEFSYDSVSYTLQKFTYLNNSWKKISDIGVLKESTAFKTPFYKLEDLVKKITRIIIEYAYN